MIRNTGLYLEPTRTLNKSAASTAARCAAGKQRFRFGATSRAAGPLKQGQPFQTGAIRSFFGVVSARKKCNKGLRCACVGTPETFHAAFARITEKDRRGTLGRGEEVVIELLKPWLSSRAHTFSRSVCSLRLVALYK